MNFCMCVVSIYVWMCEKIDNNLLYRDSWNYIISDHVIISSMKVYAH